MYALCMRERVVLLWLECSDTAAIFMHSGITCLFGASFIISAPFHFTLQLEH